MAVTPRRAREIARTRQDILEAAARAFASRGYGNATMQDIAREAGYTAASLYSYFSSKEEIIRELIGAIHAERNVALAKPMPEGLTFRQKLELMLRRQLEVANKHIDAIRFFHFSGIAGKAGGLCEVAAGDPPTSFEVVAEEFGGFFAANAKPGELGSWSPQDAALAFAGMTHLFFLRWLRGADSTVSDEGIPRLLDLFFHGVLGPKSK